MPERSAREQLDWLVQQALVSAINDHGPITKLNVSSAAKRVAGQLVGQHLTELAGVAAHDRLASRTRG